MSEQEERYAIALSRHDLPPQQFYIEEGDEVRIARDGVVYDLVVDSVEPTSESCGIRLSGTLKLC